MCACVISATTDDTFGLDAKAKKESIQHPGVAPGGSSNVSVSNALKGIEFIAQHIKNADKENEVLCSSSYCISIQYIDLG